MCVTYTNGHINDDQLSVWGKRVLDLAVTVNFFHITLPKFEFYSAINDSKLNSIEIQFVKRDNKKII